MPISVVGTALTQLFIDNNFRVHYGSSVTAEIAETRAEDVAEPQEAGRSHSHDLGILLFKATEAWFSPFARRSLGVGVSFFAPGPIDFLIYGPSGALSCGTQHSSTPERFL